MASSEYMLTAQATRRYFPTYEKSYLYSMICNGKIERFKANDRSYVRIADVERLVAERAKPH
jgi:hypothetical protein